jgi:hypothetical protein
MNMPRFTAEASLYRTGEVYRTLSINASTITQVIPQATKAPTTKNDDPACRGACKCCGVYGYSGCCARCDGCVTALTSGVTGGVFVGDVLQR